MSRGQPHDPAWKQSLPLLCLLVAINLNGADAVGGVSPRPDARFQTPYALTRTCPVDTSTTPRAQTSIGFTHESSGWLVIRETCSRSWKTGEPSSGIATPPASSATLFPSSVVISP